MLRTQILRPRWKMTMAEARLEAALELVRDHPSIHGDGGTSHV